MPVRRTSFAAIYRTVSFYGLERNTLLCSLKTALVVGTVLGLINHGSALLAGQLTAEQLVPLLVSYLVPFTVCMYGQIQGKRQRDQAQALDMQR